MLKAQRLRSSKIKGGFAHHTDAKFWQRGFTDHLILTREDFDIHRSYIL